MKILVMAAGAVGGYFGALLSKHNDVILISRGENLKAIEKNGLEIQSDKSGNFTRKVKCLITPPTNYHADLIIYCVKSYHNQEACSLLRPAVGSKTNILTLQNGIGSGDVLSDYFGKPRVVLGAAYIEAEQIEPGKIVQHGDDCQIVFGENSGLESSRAKLISQLLTKSSIDNRISTDIKTDLWKKLILICALSGMTCLTRSSFSEVLDNRQTRNITELVMREAESVSRHMKVNIPNKYIEDMMAYFLLNSSELVSSMYKDLILKKPLELSVINGAITRLGKEFEVPTPINDIITACLSLPDIKAQKHNI